MNLITSRTIKGLIIGLLVFGICLGPEAQAGKSVSNNLFVPIVTYHRVLEIPSNELDITPARLEEHFRFFRENGYHPITASQLLDWQKYPDMLPDKPLVITFDDGPKSNYTKVFPLLKKFGWAATFFVYPKVIAEQSVTQLTWEELQEMAAAGMDIQSHTLTHPYLSKVSASGSENYFIWLDRELRESKRIIETRLHRKVDLLAYPYGWYNQLVET
ncbi:MAG TPA: polysaccharide deacetylase family protein, partial [Bacillota bacterium]|nr:polysaccharide deacetylase family protein [Bacillota bacterium]